MIFIKVLGNKIRSTRRLKRLTQLNLARGICTQPTVSLIENHGQCANVEIVSKLCDRLGLTLSEVISNSFGYRFYDVEHQLLNRRYQTAFGILKSFSVNRLDYGSDRIRYFCYRGLIELNLKHNPKEALYYFNLALSVNSKRVDPIYRAWNYLGACEIYALQKDSNKIINFSKAALSYLKLVNWSLEESHFYLAVSFKVRIIKILKEIGYFRVSNQVAKLIVRELRDKDSMYKLASVYLLMANNDFNLKHFSRARHALNHARVLSHIHQDYQLISKILLAQRRILKIKKSLLK